MKNGQLLSIQYLRAFAALSIVFHHAAEQFPGFQAVFPGDIGSAGVDIFFVISGFIMVFITDLGDRNVSKFVWNRIIRIVPLYWFYSILTVFLYIIASGLFRGNALTFQHIILSLLFIPHQNPGTLSIGPLVRVGWTLDYEMFFYFIFAMSMLANYSKRILLTCLCLLILALVGVCRFDWLPAELQFYCSDIMLEFAAGMLLCRVYQTGKLNPVKLLGIGFLIIGMFVVLTNILSIILTFRSIRFGIPAVTIVAGMLSIERYLTALPLPLLLASASYSIYLSHIMSIAILRYLYPRFGIPTEGLISTLLFVSTALILGSVSGIISYLFVEKPLLNLCRNLQKR